jgi:hypothetical protein
VTTYKLENQEVPIKVDASIEEIKEEIDHIDFVPLNSILHLRRLSFCQHSSHH